MRVLFAFVGFWIYYKFIYHSLFPLYKHIRAAHLLYSLTGLLWIQGKASYWIAFLLLLNSTRIELYNISIHPNNTIYVLLHLIKNSPIVLLFHWAHSLGYSGAFTVSVLTMDVMALLMWEAKMRHWDLKFTTYLDIHVCE